jgi:hypothetical protein
MRIMAYWLGHEHIGCDCVYVTMAPNVRKYIDVPSVVVMVMLPSELRIDVCDLRNANQGFGSSSEIRSRQSPGWMAG